MTVNLDIMRMSTLAEKTKTPHKTKQNNHLLTTKGILNIKM